MLLVPERKKCDKKGLKAALQKPNSSCAADVPDGDIDSALMSKTLLRCSLRAASKRPYLLSPAAVDRAIVDQISPRRYGFESERDFTPQFVLTLVWLGFSKARHSRW